MSTKLRLPTGELVIVESIKDIRVSEGKATVETGAKNYNAKKIDFDSSLSQNEVDEIWNLAIRDVYGIIISWESHEDKSNKS